MNQASTSSTDDTRNIEKEAQKRVPEGDENETVGILSMFWPNVDTFQQSSKGKGRSKKVADSEKTIKVSIATLSYQA